MKYSKPEIEIIDFSQTEAVLTDPIYASGETTNPIPGDNGTPPMEFGYWG